jgi:hypothetical protein
MGGISRRFLNLVVDNRIRSAKCLQRLDLTCLKMFNTSTQPHRNTAATAS